MGNEFMNLSINANGFSNVQNTAAGHKAEQANKQGKSAFFAGSPVLTTKNQIEQRKKMAQKSALKLVKDAWFIIKSCLMILSLSLAAFLLHIHFHFIPVSLI